MSEKIYRYRAVCHTKCYWLENLWEVGEVYEGDIKPNKHFKMAGEPDPEKPPEGPSGDPRSTKELRETLENIMSVPKSWSRKKIWAELKSREIAISKDELTNPSTGTTQIQSGVFLAACGFEAKSLAGKVAHERTCEKCKSSLKSGG